MKRSRKKAPSPVDPQKYSAFLKLLKIVNITFPCVSWKLLNPIFGETKLKHAVTFDLQEPMVSKDNSYITIPASLKVQGFANDEENPFMEINCNQHFTVQVDPSLYSFEMLEFYVTHNTILNIVSVFREHVRYATFEMGLIPLMLPPLIFPVENKQIKSKGKIESPKKSSK